ncbi:MAG TPA: hypothetical protein VGN80_19305 [Devosiaceae bacterium]|jgi:hypothetical protein|nr:hypothetical protein [Devosiaceae bacterium]
MAIELPRFVIAKRLASGATAFYWNPPPYWRKQAEAAGRRWPFESQVLGQDLRQPELDAAAGVYNAQFDEWREGGGRSIGRIRRYAPHGSVAWLVESYLNSDTFKRRVSERARPDYRNLLDHCLSYPLKAGGSFGELPVASVTPAAAEKLYSWVIAGGRYRQGEKAVMYLKTVWRLMQPHHPREFRRDVPNPWVGVQLVSRVKEVKPAHDRNDVYAFAWKAIEIGRPEVGAAAVICFEWLQRPENVLSGYVRWPDYRGKSHPDHIRIEHHKTGQMVMHPLQEIATDGAVTLFYADAEAVLAKTPRRGLPVILRPEGTIYSPTRFAQLVRQVADAAGLPKTFSLDACRHGGMTELEEAELTDGQGRALSAHRSRAYEGYAKRTEKRMLAATRRRHAHLAGNK